MRIEHALARYVADAPPEKGHVRQSACLASRMDAVIMYADGAKST